MLIDQYVLFAAAAIFLALMRYGTYFHTIYLGKTKPHAFSWLLWGLVTGIGTFVQFSLEAGPAAWALGFASASCLAIGFIACFIGEKDYTKSDWIALVACLFAIVIWRVTDNPILAIIIIISIDFLTYFPTFRKSFNKPQTEAPISFFIAGLRYFFMLSAIPEPTWQNLAYPFFLMIMDWAFAGFIVIRRAQMGLPLHEYQKEKA